ncbi:MAG TPA: glycosyltransferase [Anaerolineales bacterium]
MPTIVFTALYTFALIGLSLYGIQSLVLALLFLFQRRLHKPVPPPDPEVWPAVTVQLPIFNERFVVERLIDAACALDYPAQALSIQVLDDSTDETLSLTRQRVALHRARGVNIELIHQVDRTGYKAGALANGLYKAAGQFIAIFDADFVPPPDFLRRLIPYLAADAKLGMVQARWGHLNDAYNLLTRAQSIFLDGHFVIEQNTRFRTGLLFNFNGSAGIWRRSCIEDAGGWQGDTLSEDLDLSYRAQMKGWCFTFVPDVVVPAEIPPSIAALKQQQYRWARGTIRVLFKLGGQLWRAPISRTQRLAGYIHLSSYFSNLFMMLALLTSLPVVLAHGAGVPSLPWLAIVGFGQPLMYAISQQTTYPDWKSRIAFFPFLLSIGAGIGFNNSRAVLAAFSRKPARFIRTPKFHLESQQDNWSKKTYSLPVEWTVWVELGLSVYALITGVLAMRDYPPLVPMMILFTVGFGYVGILGLLQGRLLSRPAFNKNEEFTDANSL